MPVQHSMTPMSGLTPRGIPVTRAKAVKNGYIWDDMKTLPTAFLCIAILPSGMGKGSIPVAKKAGG